MAQPGYEIKPIQAADTEDVMNLLRKTFFIDEPMNLAVGLCSEGTCTELENYCKKALPGDGCSFKAVDKEGNIVGAMVNEFDTLTEGDNGSGYLQMAENCANPKFKKILYVLAKREEGARLAEKFPNDDKLLDVKIAATDPNWRKRGIMNALLNETEKLAKQRGVRILRMDTSSAYSAMAAERLGFTCMYSAPYNEIKLDGRPLIVPEPPHVDDRVYIKIMFDKNN
ncbi:arylalkylamine N-acetyltransferase 1-like [Helicoverpa zea]|uniref:arylalkylamine N-acetyltransferase 1-like n=1 Tax=Helicoverpa zea TaxID=7113 RepID=UPI001F5AAE6A|nr:arylalkylamine N-acetyltransferase 1-like [Helicoverpa zea]